MSTLRYVSILALVLFAASALGARAQERSYALVVRGIALDEALDRFVQATGRAVSYEPALVEGKRTFCALPEGDAEALLQCILAGSGLDYVRLSSGTYVLTRRTEAAPVFGTMAGTVVDEQSGSPLAGAHVLLADAGVGAVTNEAGQFVLPALLPGQYAVHVTYLGYRDWSDSLRIAPDGHTTATAALRPEPLLVAPIVVDGLQRARLSDRFQAESVDPASELRTTGRTPLPAAAGLRRTDVTTDVHVQGGDAGAHQFRIDGVPLYLPRRPLGLVGPFSPLAIDRITVNKAGFGAMHGSRMAGTIEAEQVLGGPPGAIFHVDPLSVQGRLQVGRDDPRATSGWAVMAAARRGLWSVRQPQALQSTLTSWSTPDVFLLGAPLRIPGRAEFNAASSDLTVLRSQPPALRFSDVHAAVRRRWSPLRSTTASYYEGRTRLGGSAFASEVNNLAVADRDATAYELYRIPVTLADAYTWRTRAGQLRMDAVLGNRTLVSAQLRGSAFGLDHQYETLDSLQLYIGAEQIDVDRIRSRPVADANRVREGGAEVRLEHAWQAHYLEVGAEATVVDSRFALLAAGVPGLNLDALPVDPVSNEQVVERLGAPQAVVRAEARSARFAVAAADTWRISRDMRLELGTRLTYLPIRQTVYAEPRLALQYDGTGWAARGAAGLYRQYVNQFDVSTLNPGALLPSARVWLPVDSSVRPPVSYHVSAAASASLGAGWTFGAESYWKHEPHRLMMTYRLPDAADEAPTADTYLTEQNTFLASARGRAYGGAVRLTRDRTPLRTELRYAYSQAEQRSAALFDGRTVTAPWNEPHVVHLATDWRPFEAWTFSARAEGGWGRAWGYRQAYYDYFGQSPELRVRDGIDFGRPDDHRLPARYRLDLGAAYRLTLGAAHLLLRLDVRNALDHATVLDWQLDFADDGRLMRVPRHSYPRLFFFGVQLGW